MRINISLSGLGPQYYFLLTPLIQVQKYTLTQTINNDIQTADISSQGDLATLMPDVQDACTVNGQAMASVRQVSAGCVLRIRMKCQCAALMVTRIDQNAT